MLNKEGVILSQWQKTLLIRKIKLGMQANPRYKKYVEDKLREVAWRRFSNDSQT